jgi:hypothetical protein
MARQMRPAEGKSVWLGSQIDYRQEGMHALSASDVTEIDGALKHLKAQGEVDFAAITQQNFPLPKLGERLRALGEELRTGRGFLLLRGLPLTRWAADDLARIYVGLGVQIGKLLPQSYHGELLGHVIDVSDLEQDARGYHAGGGQAFHTDTCDIISLMCVRGAKSGGLSRIASAAAVHNRLLETRPDLLELLYDGYVCRRMELDAERGSGVLVKKVAFFSQASGTLSCNISGSYPRRADAAGDGKMTALQLEALEALQGLAATPEFHLDMTIGEGDIQFLNNRVIVHGRTAYEDWPEVARRRHLMRLWIEVAGWPPLPANQGMHSADDHRGWLRFRRPFMELPSRYMAEMTQRHKELVG